MMPSGGLGPIYDVRQLASAVTVRRTAAGHEFVGKVILLAFIVLGFLVVIHFLPLLANTDAHAVVHQVQQPTSSPRVTR